MSGTLAGTDQFKTPADPAPARGGNRAGRGSRSRQRYGEFLLLRRAHEDLKFWEYLKYFAGRDGRI